MQGREFFKKYEIRNMKNVIRKLPVFLLPLLILGIYLLFRANLISQDSWKVILGFSFSFAFALSLVPFRDDFNFKVPKKFEKWLPYIIVGLGCFVYAIYGLVNHFHFQTHAYDFGFFDQVIWKLSRFKNPSSTIIFINHFLCDHFQPILYLVAPIYWIYNHPTTLILFEISIVCLGSLPIFWLAKKKFEGALLPAILALTYIFFVGNQYALAFTFHPSTLFATLFLFAFYFFEKKKYFWHFVFVFLALMCKENVGLYIAALGIYYLVKKRIIGLIHLILGPLWFYLAWKILPPLFGEVPTYHYDYFPLGAHPLEAIKTILTRPFYTLFLIFNHPIKIETLLILFGSFGFLAFLTPSFLIVALTMLGERFFSAVELKWVMGFHYGAPISAILILSIIDAVIYLKNRIKFPWEFFISGFLLLNLGAMTYLTQAPLHNLVLHPSFYKSTPSIQSAHKALKLIPKNASVSAQEDFVPHLAHRDEIYEFPNGLGSVQFLFLDVLGNTYPLKREEYAQYIKKVLENSDYGIKFNEKSVVVFEKGLKSEIKPSQELTNVSQGIF